MEITTPIPAEEEPETVVVDVLADELFTAVNTLRADP
jgi:hypothetical protein